MINILHGWPHCTMYTLKSKHQLGCIVSLCIFIKLFWHLLLWFYIRCSPQIPRANCTSRHNGHMFCLNSTQVGVLKQSMKECLPPFNEEMAALWTCKSVANFWMISQTNCWNGKPLMGISHLLILTDFK